MSTKYIIDNLSGQTINGQPIDPKYKVFTALLTQSGGDNIQTITSGVLSIGTTYTIEEPGKGDDFTNVGAPNNSIGTSFIATGTTPSAWSSTTLGYNTGAPVATVLENTIGNIWFTYVAPGSYNINSDALFTIDKTWGVADAIYDTPNGSNKPVLLDFSNTFGTILPNNFTMVLQGGDFSGDNLLNTTPIEIRVYN